MGVRVFIILVFLLGVGDLFGAEQVGAGADQFPPALESYGDQEKPLWTRLHDRATAEPMNLVASIIFLCAIIHTFMAPRILHLSHKWEKEHQEKIRREGRTAGDKPQDDAVSDVCFKAEVAHFFGEVEAIFGIWVVPLLVSFLILKDWHTAANYINHEVTFTEPMFVVVIMAIASTRPILRLAETVLGAMARMMGGSTLAWWLAILTFGPLGGSFITEPAAMTICALLLAKKFYETKPSLSFAYGTIALLFVNISIGGTLTHFAAPPVLMVAGKWKWGFMDMFTHFGVKAAIAIVVSNIVYLLWYRKELEKLRAIPNEPGEKKPWVERDDAIPALVTVIHVFFLAWTVFTAHSPALFIGGFLFFLAFTMATEHHQNPVMLRPALLVGFFLAGLVVHGGLQSWWIGPVLQSLNQQALFFGAVALTAFNDNAAITYLASLVPTLSAGMKYAVVAGAVTGGGLTVIANAPNPAGQSILSKYFPDGVSPLGLFLKAVPATIIAALAFLLM